MSTILYQPELTEDFLKNNLNFYSFFVYRDLKNAKEDHPESKILAYLEGEIVDPAFIDDDDDRSITYYVDIPQLGSEELLNVNSFKIRQDAIDFAIEKFGADDQGCISLISQS